MYAEFLGCQGGRGVTGPSGGVFGESMGRGGGSRYFWKILLDECLKYSLYTYGSHPG